MAWSTAVASVILPLALSGAAWAQSPSAAPRALQDLRSQLLGGSQIGVNVRDLDAAEISRDKLPAGTGVVVDTVHPNSPAEKAGIEAGDVIVSFDGECVRSARQLTRLVNETPAGREVGATVVRNGAHVDLKVAPEENAGLARMNPRAAGPNGQRDAPFMSQRPNRSVPERQPQAGDHGGLGVTVQDLSPQLGQYFGAQTGVLVGSVADGSPAAAAGMKAGDVVTQVNGAPVTSPSDLADKIAAASGRTALTVVRDHRERTIDVDLAGGSTGGDAPRRITK